MQQRELHLLALKEAFPQGRAIRGRPLSGGVSSGAARWDIALADGTVRQVVVRSPSYMASENPAELARAELRVLELVRAHGFPAPLPLAVIDSVPALVLEHVPGHLRFEPTAAEEIATDMARHLTQLHRLDVSAAELARLPSLDTDVRGTLRSLPPVSDESMRESFVRSKLDPSLLRPRNAEVIVHGDYWPGNVIWQGDTLAAVIDWEQARRGEPLADVAIARLDMLWAFGSQAMHTFTSVYAALTSLNWSTLAAWDLWAALRPMGQLATWAPAYAQSAIARPDLSEKILRTRHAAFVDGALARGVNVPGNRSPDAVS